MKRATLFFMCIAMGVSGYPRMAQAQPSTSTISPSGVQVLRSDVQLRDGRRLGFLRWPESDKPAIILLHGKDGNATVFQTLAETIRDRFDVYAVDLRGRGFSDWAPDGDYTLESTVADIEQMADALGLSRVSVYGHSYGAVVGIAFAARNPLRVNLLVLEDGGPINMSDGSQPPLNPGQDRPAGLPSPQPSARKYASWSEAHKSLVKTCRGTCAELQLEGVFKRLPDASVVERSDIIGIWQSPRGPGFADQWPLVSAIKAPTLLIRGDRGLLPEAIAQAMKSVNSKITYVTIQNAGHSVRIEQPALAIAALDEFLQRHVSVLAR